MFIAQEAEEIILPLEVAAQDLEDLQERAVLETVHLLQHMDLAEALIELVQHLVVVFKA